MNRNACQSHGTQSKCFQSFAALVSCHLQYVCYECLVKDPEIPILTYHLSLQEFATNDVCERFFPTKTLDGRIGRWNSKTFPEPQAVAETEGVIGLKAIKPCATVLQCSARLAKKLWDSRCMYMDVPR